MRVPSYFYGKTKISFSSSFFLLFLLCPTDWWLLSSLLPAPGKVLDVLWNVSQSFLLVLSWCHPIFFLLCSLLPSHFHGMLDCLSIFHLLTPSSPFSHFLTCHYLHPVPLFQSVDGASGLQVLPPTSGRSGSDHVVLLGPLEPQCVHEWRCELFLHRKLRGGRLDVLYKSRFPLGFLESRILLIVSCILRKVLQISFWQEK